VLLRLIISLYFRREKRAKLLGFIAGSSLLLWGGSADSGDVILNLGGMLIKPHTQTGRGSLNIIDVNSRLVDSSRSILVPVRISF
jgi:hypothetical protein